MLLFYLFVPGIQRGNLGTTRYNRESACRCIQWQIFPPLSSFLLFSSRVLRGRRWDPLMAEGGRESADTRRPIRTSLSDKRVNGISPLNILYMEYSDANTWTSCWEIRAPDADLTPQGRPWEPRPPTSTRPDPRLLTSSKLLLTASLRIRIRATNTENASIELGEKLFTHDTKIVLKFSESENYGRPIS